MNTASTATASPSGFGPAGPQVHASIDAGPSRFPAASGSSSEPPASAGDGPPAADTTAGGAPLRRLGAEAPAKKPRSRLGMAAGLALLVAAGGGGGWYLQQQQQVTAPTSPASAASAPVVNPAIGKTVVATIDGKPVLEAELASLLAGGADRAVAIDRYINKVLASEAARQRYADDARTLVTAAEREILANLYLQRRNQELTQAVTDAQIAEYYKANVRDEDYAAFKLRYYLTRDQADAANVRTLIDKNDKAALAKLAPLGNTSDGFLPFQGIPYGLGQVVRRAKTGEVIGPVLVRDGLLVLVLDDVRAGKKPEQDAVKNEIRALLADRQLSEELLGLRKKAQIQLN